MGAALPVNSMATGSNCRRSRERKSGQDAEILNVVEPEKAEILDIGLFRAKCLGAKRHEDGETDRSDWREGFSLPRLTWIYKSVFQFLIPSIISIQEILK